MSQRARLFAGTQGLESILMSTEMYLYGMRRREFFTLFGCATAWSFAARAQQGDRMLPVGVLMGYGQNDPEEQIRVAAFREDSIAPR